MKVNTSRINRINRNFQEFSKKATTDPNITKNNFYNSLTFQVHEYSSCGLLETMCEKLSELATTFVQLKKVDFAGMIYSKLVKLEQIPFSIKEQLILKAIEVAKLQEDKIHMVSRLEDLRRFYENQQDNIKSLKILTREENVLKDIICDFETAKKNFKSIVYQTSKVENFEQLLASVQIDIAKITMMQKPKKSIQKLNSAIEILERVGDKEHYEYAKKLLDKATFYRNAKKISKRNRC